MKNKKYLMHLECNEKKFCFILLYNTVLYYSFSPNSYHIPYILLPSSDKITKNHVINYKAVAQIMKKTCNVLCKMQGRQLWYLQLSIF